MSTAEIEQAKANVAELVENIEAVKGKPYLEAVLATVGVYQVLAYMGTQQLRLHRAGLEKATDLPEGPFQVVSSLGNKVYELLGLSDDQATDVHRDADLMFRRTVRMPK